MLLALERAREKAAEEGDCRRLHARYFTQACDVGQGSLEPLRLPLSSRHWIEALQGSPNTHLADTSGGVRFSSEDAVAEAVVSIPSSSAHGLARITERAFVEMRDNVFVVATAAHHKTS